MIFSYLLNFNDEFFFFKENFNLKQNYFDFDSYVFFFFLDNLFQYNELNLLYNNNLTSNFIINFIDQADDASFFKNLENVKSIYHYSIPNTRLSYPEPFVASASFMHSDLWFMHILIFQYWLWFVFIFLIVFFFLTFICTVRWCNMRIKPRRETRGVSRSKCGDLITACVPVSWATSIIVHESTDAIDYFDGFGTTEMVVGVRAYQWGWEYYYPKDLDLNYNIKNNFSSFVGNSLKYNTTTDLNLRSTNLWKFYQNKNLDNVVTPAHLLVLPFDNYKTLNFLNFNDIGSNPLHESAAFKKVRMFSKFSSNNLIDPTFNFSSKYKFFFNNFLDKNSFLQSTYPGIKRQHNFLNNSAMVGNYSTFFNLKSVYKFLNFTLDNNATSVHTFNKNSFFNFIKKKNDTTLTAPIWSNLNINDFFANSVFTKSLRSILFYPSVLKTINDDSDKNKILYPILKINENLFKSSFTRDLHNINMILNNNEINVFNFNQLKSSFNNINLSYQNYFPFGPNQSVGTNEKTLRNFASMNLNKVNYNYNNSYNQINSYINLNKTNIHSNNFFYFNVAMSNWADFNNLSRLLKTNIYSDYPHAPIISNNPSLNFLDYDNYKNTLLEDIPTPLQGKEEQMPFYLLNVYWNFYWNNSNTDIRINNNLDFFNINNSFYFPLFTLYYDYDFRNWQSLELMEDNYWESVFSVYTLDEYLNLVNDFYQPIYSNKYLNFFVKDDKILNFKNNVISKPILKDLKSSGNFYSNFFYLDDNLSPLHLLNTNNFFIFPLINNQTYWEDSYESNKFLNYFFNSNFKIFLFSFSNSFFPYSYSTVFDMFRSDYDDFSWYTDDNNFQKKNLFFSPQLNNLLDLNIFNYNFLYNFDFSNFNNTRFTNNINLRNSVKSSIVTYNAIQKVFKARFDEGRSNTKIDYLSSFYPKQLYLSLNRIKYERILGKNKENFMKINLYKSNNVNILNLYNPIYSSLNFYFFDFPFLLAHKSDASRYLWFDWYSKWGFYEVQPSSSSRYAIYGMPYFNKNFEFGANYGDTLLETENYLIRLARSRKNYLPNWTYNPYLYSKSNLWTTKNDFNEIYNIDYSIYLNKTKFLLATSNVFWTKIHYLYSNCTVFTPSNSNLNSYSKTLWQPAEGISSYFFSISSLIDILTKREFLYRQFLESNHKIVNLPFFLTNNPNNPLIKEVKSSFMFIDPISYNNEYSRNLYYSSLAFFNFNLLKSYLLSCSNILNADFIVNYFFFYFFNYDTNINKNLNDTLIKSQYRPLKKGITNMIRLHATGAIAMPIEIRLQILASSKDVIHSWAIPSAGIKIDCIPGYSSHKVAIFLVSGIFWGQCMEICGRYHHWMPIVVYFMKRDLFFLWCTHFVFLSGSNDMWNINDRQYTDYIKQVSFDKSTWVSELTN